MSERNFLFIVNPFSGKSKVDIKLLINKNLDSTIKAVIKETKYPKQAITIAKENHENFDAVIAVGGDGTVNEVAQGLLNSQTPMGIIPTGSGNGLARELNYSMDLKTNIRQLHTLKSRKMNIAFWNKELFLCAAGVGFDGLIAHKFAKNKTRGLATYIKLIFSTYWNFKTFNVTVNDCEYPKTFICSVLNSGQYGNDFKLSPKKSLFNEQLELVIIKKPNIFQAPLLLFYAYYSDVNKLSFVQRINGKHFEIKANNQYHHLDGEVQEKSDKAFGNISFKSNYFQVLTR